MASKINDTLIRMSEDIGELKGIVKQVNENLRDQNKKLDNVNDGTKKALAMATETKNDVDEHKKNHNKVFGWMLAMGAILVSVINLVFEYAKVHLS